MHSNIRRSLRQTLTYLGLSSAAILAVATGAAAPAVSRLTPPSALFTFNDPNPPYIARFLPGQRFDLQASVKLDPGQTLDSARFWINGSPLRGTPTILHSGSLASIEVTAGGSGYTSAPTVSIAGGGGAIATAIVDAGVVVAIQLVNAGSGYVTEPAITFSGGGGGTGAAAVSTVNYTTGLATLRAYSHSHPGVHTLQVKAVQADGQAVEAQGNFEVVELRKGLLRAKNIIYLIGDGMGIAHRTAARLMLHGAQLGKANAALAMDTLPVTGLVMTHSLNSIVTDSSPGAACYATGNKSNNNQQGVFPDDTADAFDNPRVELIGEYLWRKEGRTLGIVTTSDVFDATPGAFGTHTANRGAGTGICDQYLDEAVAQGGLRVLLGGGRKWFLPSGTPGSQRSAGNDYSLPTELADGWNVAAGTLDASRDLVADFQSAGFYYAPDLTSLDATPAQEDRLLGLFSYSNMNVAKDKIDKRRNPGAPGVVDDYLFPDQPMLDEMAAKALQVLSKNRKGFTLMIEAASIDKQAHNMDTERWILDTIEFDRAIAVCKQFAECNPDTLVVVTADHECAGVNIIGASRVTQADLATRASSAGGAAQLRTGVVGTYEAAGFPVYQTAEDGYPVTTDPDRKMLIGYAANADRYEDWITNPQPLRDTQQPFNNAAPLNTYPTGPLNRDVAGNFLVTGQIPDAVAAHTASDIPVSAFGRGAYQFTGVMDNTDVFFKVMKAAYGVLQ